MFAFDFKHHGMKHLFVIWKNCNCMHVVVTILFQNMKQIIVLPFSMNKNLI